MAGDNFTYFLELKDKGVTSAGGESTTATLEKIAKQLAELKGKAVKVTVQVVGDEAEVDSLHKRLVSKTIAAVEQKRRQLHAEEVREAGASEQAASQHKRYMESSFSRGIRISGARLGSENPDVDWALDRKLRASNTAYLKEQEKLGKVIPALAKSSEEATEKLTPFQHLMDLVGKGQIRRGFAVGVTEAMGGGPIAEAIGGMSGAIASSIFLPIGWAIGNMIMQLPQHISEKVDWNRYVGSIGARAGGSLSGGAWNENTSLVENYFGRIYGDKQEWIRNKVPAMMLAYQGTGPRGIDQIEESQRAAQRAYVIGLLEVGGLESDSIGMMKALKMLDYGSMNEKSAALSQLADKGYIHQQLVQEAMKERGWSGPRGEYRAEALVKSRLDIPVGLRGAYTPRHIEYLMEQVAKNDPRVVGEMEKQRDESRITPEEGWQSLLFGPTAIQLSQAEARYVRQRAKLEKEYAAGQRSFGGVFGYGALSYEELKSNYRKQEYYEAHGKNMPDGFLDKRLNDLENLALGKAGNSSALPFGGGDEKTRGWLPMQYQFTSFSGLAEQMQMQLSGQAGGVQDRMADDIRDMRENGIKIKEAPPPPGPNHPAREGEMVNGGYIG